jgi:hypothetical protein
MIKVYQIQLTDEEIAIVNRGESTPRTKAYMDRMFDSTFKAENFQYYDLVANVDVDGFEQAFRAMNLWQDDVHFDRVEKLGRCSSMSVGDIVEDHDGKLYRCASFGFTALENI